MTEAEAQRLANEFLSTIEKPLKELRVKLRAEGYRLTMRNTGDYFDFGLEVLVRQSRPIKKQEKSP